MAIKGAKYYVNRGNYGRVGTATSLERAKKMIAKDGEFLTKYRVIRITAKGTESLVGVYQNKSRGYRYGNRMVVVVV